MNRFAVIVLIFALIINLCLLSSCSDKSEENDIESSQNISVPVSEETDEDIQFVESTTENLNYS